MIDGSQYARINDDGHIETRSSIYSDFDSAAAWSPADVREFAARLLELADQAERASLKVKELTRALDAIGGDENPGCTWEDMAVELVRKGWHK
jgi:hypothetical protein